MEVAYTPVVSLQCDWEVSLNTKTKDTIWLSSSIYDSQNKRTSTKQGEVTFTPDKNDFTVTSTPPFSVSIVNSELKWIRVKTTDDTNSIDTDVYAPTRQLQNPSKQAIRSLGVSPQGGLVAFGSDEGILRVADVRDASIMRNLEGHKGDVTLSKFFPSGQVVLSGALDWRLKIWNIASGDCAATLTGHGGSVLGADFIERGRNIISCSRDGTARLWDVPTQATIATFSSGSHSALNDCCVFDGFTSTSDKTTDEREVGTEGKAVITAGDDGALRVFDLRSKDQVINFPSPPAEKEGERDAYNCCASAELNASRLIVGGTESGHIVAWDIRNSSNPIHAVRLTTAPIKKLSFCNGKTWAATGDGSAVGLKWESSSSSSLSRSRVSTVLSGSDNDPIIGMSVVPLADGHTLAATGARDGVVRLYCNIK